MELEDIFNRDQADAAIRSFGKVVWAYRCGLIDSGATEDQANFLSLALQNSLLERFLKV